MNASVAAQPNRPLASKLTLERVEPPAGQAHVLRACGSIRLRELPRQPGSVGGLNTCLAAVAEKRRKALVSERCTAGMRWWLQLQTNSIAWRARQPASR